MKNGIGDWSERIQDLKGVKPESLAARLRTRVGMFFLDSAREREGEEMESLVGIEPEFSIVGNLFVESDFQKLKTVVETAGKSFVVGGVEYDGAYEFGVYRKVLLYRHGSGEWFGNGEVENWWDAAVVAESEAKSIFPQDPLEFQAQMENGTYVAMVERVQEYIAAGDIYQANVSYPFVAQWRGDDLWPFYLALRRYSPAPYGAYLRMGKRTVLSTSPELFLKIAGRNIQTRPIKGTRPRIGDVVADAISEKELAGSAKEAAELVMITDLERNDLGQVCEWGSVEVTELLKLEKFEQVYHLVSTVEGRLREGMDRVSALRACFPGGSITGAPKKRAREVIAELEPFERGFYTGVTGYFGPGEKCVMNIAIRTVVATKEELRFGVGAGIVADSVPEHEWQETLDKAAGILLAAKNVSA